MEKVVGIGGVFVRAKNQEELARWYAEHLGLDINEQWWGAPFPLSTPDAPAGSYVIWGSFPADTDYFGSRENSFMVNFRVHDLDAMLAQLRAGGCDVADDVQRSDFGDFGWVTDPEGNRVELWQPPDSLPGDVPD